MNKFCITCGAETNEANVCPRCGAVQDAVYAVRNFCDNCGSAIKHKAKTCGKCGVKIPKPSHHRPIHVDTDTKASLTLIAIALPLIMIAAYLLTSDLSGTPVLGEWTDEIGLVALFGGLILFLSALPISSR